MTLTEILPDDAALREGRRARVLAEMESADIDILILGREANARYVSGARRLWNAGSRAFGPGCVLVRETGEIHMMSTWDEGIPDDIPRENLYGITFNPMNIVAVLKDLPGAATAGRVATDALTPLFAQLLPMSFPAADLVDGEELMRASRRVKLPDEVHAIRNAVRVAEIAMAAAAASLRPGISERHLTGLFMQSMAEQGVTTPATQDVAWITSRERPWQRRDDSDLTQNGDLVVFSAGIISDGYVGELGRTHTVGATSDAAANLFATCDQLMSSLVAACRVGAPTSDLLAVYDAAGLPQPPMPVAHGLGLGFDVPLVTTELASTAAEQRFESGMVIALTSYVARPGVGAVFVQEPVHVAANGVEPLSARPFGAASSSPQI